MVKSKSRMENYPACESAAEGIVWSGGKLILSQSPAFTPSGGP